ncbi:MAG: hypothetical protein ACR650_00705 [Methylocystis sp.]
MTRCASSNHYRVARVKPKPSGHAAKARKQGLLSRKKKGGDERLAQASGFVAGAGDDDSSGVPTYSQDGAAFGCSLLWVVLLTDAADLRRAARERR